MYYGHPRFQKENQYEFPEDKQAKYQENSSFDSIAITGKQLNEVLFCQIDHLPAKVLSF